MADWPKILGEMGRGDAVLERNEITQFTTMAGGKDI
jgi:hypothetical protein